MENETQEQTNNRPWLFQPGVSGNPGGRKKGSKSLKTFVKEMLIDMDDAEKLEFIRGLDKKTIWEMAEDKPKQGTDITSGGESLQPILVKFINANDRNTPGV